MPLPADQIEELKRISPEIAICDEGGNTFILLPDFQLPPGCEPDRMDLLLCPTQRDGYNSRLFFHERVQPPQGRHSLNWNGSVRIAERNWDAFSWRTPTGLRLAQMLSIHLKAIQ